MTTAQKEAYTTQCTTVMTVNSKLGIVEKVGDEDEEQEFSETVNALSQEGKLQWVLEEYTVREIYEMDA